jgi:hypothetical protein
MKSVVAEKNTKQGVSRYNLRALVLALILGALVVLSCGCGSWWTYPGETAAEGNRRHKRVVKNNFEEMRADIDTVLLLDRPSMLTDKRLP